MFILILKKNYPRFSQRWFPYPESTDNCEEHKKALQQSWSVLQDHVLIQQYYKCHVQVCVAVIFCPGQLIVHVHVRPSEADLSYLHWSHRALPGVHKLPSKRILLKHTDILALDRDRRTDILMLLQRLRSVAVLTFLLFFIASAIFWKFSASLSA